MSVASLRGGEGVLAPAEVAQPDCRDCLSAIRVQGPELGIGNLAVPVRAGLSQQLGQFGR